jgi:uncharacterized membrane protein
MNDHPAQSMAHRNSAIHPFSHALHRSVIALVCLLCADWIWWHSQRYSGQTALVFSLVGVLPWLLMLPSLWRGQRTQHVAATLLLSPYLAYGLMDWVANPGAKGYALSLVLIATALFMAVIVYLRLSRPMPLAPT